ncbi:hypothetical protein C8R46DRAFT_1089194 [Mycena filopes]|nr:hypothetical protein C8R46DRAFT_1089194 [Mycena filopes]
MICALPNRRPRMPLHRSWTPRTRQQSVETAVVETAVAQRKSPATIWRLREELDEPTPPDVSGINEINCSHRRPFPRHTCFVFCLLCSFTFLVTSFEIIHPSLYLLWIPATAIAIIDVDHTICGVESDDGGAAPARVVVLKVMMSSPTARPVGIVFCSSNPKGMMMFSEDIPRVHRVVEAERQ